MRIPLMLIVGVLIIIGSSAEILLLLNPSMSSFVPIPQPYIIIVLVSFHLIGIAFVVKSLLGRSAVSEKQTGGYHKK